uniref:Uncharacterized protein n=1 Tax=viral metagenome TaxID=1070528 RepID=A0A6H2A351_9ZZZZ
MSDEDEIHPVHKHWPWMAGKRDSSFPMGRWYPLAHNAESMEEFDRFNRWSLRITTLLRMQRYTKGMEGRP